MQIAMIGLGRIGSNMARRLLRAGHECVVFDRSREHILFRSYVKTPTGVVAILTPTS